MRSRHYSFLLLLVLALHRRHHHQNNNQLPFFVSAWTWSLSANNDNVSAGPRVSGHSSVASPVRSPGGNDENDKIFLFGGVHEKLVESFDDHDAQEDNAAGPALDVTGGAGASVGARRNGGNNKNKNKMFNPLTNKVQTAAEARAESEFGNPFSVMKSRAGFAEERQQQQQQQQSTNTAINTNANNNESYDPLGLNSATITATHDLWIYEKDKQPSNRNHDSDDDDAPPDWTLISRKVQGITRPTPRSHAAAAVLGHMMFLFGGHDPETDTELTDVWTLSLKTYRWSKCQAWMPYGASRHAACAISDTKIGIFTERGDVLVYDDDLPTPSVEEMKTSGEGPGDGLSLFSCCAIPRRESADAITGGDEEVVGDLVRADSGTELDMLIFGGSAGDIASDAFRLDTKSWEWTKLVPKSATDECPPGLQGASIASLGKNTGQCIVFGGAKLDGRSGSVRPSDETWLLAVDGDDARWERIAADGGPGAAAGGPEGRLAASLTATNPEELVLQGGYDPTTKRTYGGAPGAAGGGGTWMLTKNPIDRAELARGKEARRKRGEDARQTRSEAAASRVSDIIARAGSGMGFDGTSLGVGGLDHVLEEVKTRIWTPLAAPPILLKELGIQPTRGLLLYGGPGCGKTLLASTLGSMLSPFRPITVVNGPEILDKFVGSSEENLRAIFDNPPDIHDEFKKDEADGGAALGRAAVHVVVMDEFDAVARARGGGSGSGGQGDAGVARDSVVNQLLSKMDGVQPLKVPTLVIGLTNKKDLIDPALLRPGRFEVQIEIEPPKTVEQRRSIVLVHTKKMFDAGRLQVNDPPPGTAAANQLENTKHLDILTYDQLADQLATDCHGFSGAAIAGVARAAAARALARSVGSLSGDLEYSSADPPSSIMDCLVTQDDFYQAIFDVRGRSVNNGYAAEEEQGNDRHAAKDEGVKGEVIGGFRGDPSRDTNQKLEMENTSGNNQNLHGKVESLEEVVQDLRKSMKMLLEQNEELKRLRA